MITHRFIVKGMAITGLVSMLIACGGGGNGTSSSESIVARGVITSLGSIWVNGVEYETPNGGSYSQDDNTSTTASYQVGQVVSIRGMRHSDGVSGIATEVDYEAELEGAASGGAINGVTILIASNANVALASLDVNGNLIDNNRYEVSGFWLDNSTIEATFVKDDDDGDSVDEVRGFVEAVPSGTSLTVHGLTYTYTGIPAIAVGDLVEIHFDPDTLIASRVEFEDDFFDGQADGQEVEIEGAVNTDIADLSANCALEADFMIDLTCIDWDFVDSWEDGLTGPVDMVSGLRVEAEGHFNADGLLLAEKIKGRGNQVRITAIVSNVDGTGGPGTLDVFGGAIQVTTQSGLTEIEDTIFNTGGFEIRGIRTGATSVLAVRIKADSVGTNEHELRAEIDENGVDSSSPNIITVMGISSIVDSSTKLEDEDNIIATGGATAEAVIDSFLNSIDDDNIVNITNGPRDVIEVRIDTSIGQGTFGSPYTAIQVEIEREDD